MFSKTFDIVFDISRKYEEFFHNAIVELHNFFVPKSENLEVLI
jgi:hypothetical protein